MQTKQEYLLGIPFEYILGFSRETGLIRRKEYFTKKDFVHRLLRTLNLSECKNLNNYYQKGISYKTAVEEFLGSYPTAELISKRFVEYLTININNLGTLCFEFPITKTRVDILRLENETYAYEVKSQRDRIDRLDYQLPALQKVFEYTLIIIPSELKSRIERIIHNDVGIITYLSEYGQITFEIDREPEIANDLNEYRQLNLLRLDELMAIYMRTFRKIPNEKRREKLVAEIILNLDCSQINEVFKLTLRNRSKSQTRTPYLQNFIKN